MTLSFTVPLSPVAQERVRHRVVTTRQGKSFVAVYKSTKQQEREAEFKLAIARHRPKKLLEGPLDVEIVAYFPIPKSWPKKRLVQVMSGSRMHSSKPDTDNLAKHALDCMTGDFFKDDAEISVISVVKQYDENPRWEIRISEIRDSAIEDNPFINLLQASERRRWSPF